MNYYLMLGKNFDILSITSKIRNFTIIFSKMEILKKIIREKNNRVRLIKEFQEIIFNDENASEVLSELAYDLDFYQPDEELRKESNSYYGDEKLEREIEEALKKSVTS